MTYTTVYWGERGENASYAGDPANPDDGFDELLDAHDYYDLPGNFHLSGTLMTAAEWHDPAFNDRLETGVAQGWAQMLTSAYAQHIMPFVYDDMNSWAVYTEREMVHYRYGQWPSVAWVPERTWLESPDSDGNGINASLLPERQRDQGRLQGQQRRGRHPRRLRSLRLQERGLRRPPRLRRRTTASRCSRSTTTSSGR